jgi:hypothetical protein
MPAFAQLQATTTDSVSVLPVIDYPRGTWTSVNYPLTARTTDRVSVRLNIPSTAEYEDTRNSVVVTVYVLEDGVWRLGPSASWSGGRFVDKRGVVNPPPTLRFPVNEPNGWDMRGKPMRVEVEVQRQMGVGVTVVATLLPPSGT